MWIVQRIYNILLTFFVRSWSFPFFFVLRNLDAIFIMNWINFWGFSVLVIKTTNFLEISSKICFSNLKWYQNSPSKELNKLTNFNLFRFVPLFKLPGNCLILKGSLTTARDVYIQTFMTIVKFYKNNIAA